MFIRSTAAPEKFVERLQKESTVTTGALNVIASQSCVRRLTKASPFPELFLQKYEELKSKKFVILHI